MQLAPGHAKSGHHSAYRESIDFLRQHRLGQLTPVSHTQGIRDLEKFIQLFGYQ